MADFDQSKITNFFKESADRHNMRDSWLKMFPKSGYALTQKIPADAVILDVGCGKNLFKPYFHNLTGIDVIGNECDFQVALLDFVPDTKFDIVLCLGSIFGSIDDIRQQIAHIKSMLVAGGKIYWRNHPALPEWDSFPKFFYQWTEQTHWQLANEFGFVVNEVCKESFFSPILQQHRYRIYAEWTLTNTVHTLP